MKTFRKIKSIIIITNFLIPLILASSCARKQPQDFFDLSLHDFLSRDMATQNRPALQVYLLEQMKTRAPSQDTALASHYFTGLGTVRNETRARDLFLSAADRGDKKAQFCLSMLYLQSQNLVDSMMWLEIASKGNNKYSNLAAEYKEQLAAKLAKEQVSSARVLAEAWKSKHKNISNEKVP